MGALIYLALLWAGLVGWTRLVGQPLVSSAALALVALPYGAQVLLAPLPDGVVLDAVRHGPLAALAGTFGGADVLRQGSSTSCSTWPRPGRSPTSTPVWP